MLYIRHTILLWFYHTLLISKLHFRQNGKEINGWMQAEGAVLSQCRQRGGLVHQRRHRRQKDSKPLVGKNLHEPLLELFAPCTPFLVSASRSYFPGICWLIMQQHQFILQHKAPPKEAAQYHCKCMYMTAECVWQALQWLHKVEHVIAKGILRKCHCHALQRNKYMMHFLFACLGWVLTYLVMPACRCNISANIHTAYSPCLQHCTCWYNISQHHWGQQDCWMPSAQMSGRHCSNKWNKLH